MRAPLSFFEMTPTGRYDDFSSCVVTRVDFRLKDLELVLP